VYPLEKALKILALSPRAPVGVFGLFIPAFSVLRFVLGRWIGCPGGLKIISALDIRRARALDQPY
jgi:hypothetical protein